MDTTITSTQTLTLYSAGYDQFGNYIDDIDTTVWTSGGTLLPTPPTTFPDTTDVFTFDPDSVGSGKIFLSASGVQGDSTGLITVNPGVLSSLKIQTDSLDVNSEVGNLSFAAGQDTTLFAVGYDLENNRIGVINSDWTMNDTSLGVFDNGQPAINNTGEVIFTAEEVGSGVITATAVSNSSVSDQTGVFTVDVGTPVSITIRSAANNSGFAYRDTALTISADTSLSLFAAAYDAFGNFTGDTPVNWGSDNLSGIPTATTSSIVFNPTQIDTGQIYTQSALTDDTTGTITVVAGALAKIRIQSTAGATGSEVESINLTAGEDTALYAGGYDSDDNFISLISSNWTLEGDPIGTLVNPNPATNNVLSSDSVGSAVVRATQVAAPNFT
ncbi:MAG: hypothetical protein GWO08_17240, partial [Gammaproteobacteria bacterium]|nr:hypothetical protein [Gammaproteobacteria bacterium]